MTNMKTVNGVSVMSSTRSMAIDPQLRQYSDLSEDLEKKSPIDFISQSPLEILCCIIRYLPLNTITQCTNVCNAWRIRLLYSPLFWHVMDMQHSMEAQTGVLLRSVSQHVRKLTVRDESRGIMKCISLLGAGGFSSLRSLSFHLPANRYDMNLANELYDALPYVAPTLADLQIQWKYTYNYFTVAISLGRLLSICRNLTSISLDVNEITDCSCRPLHLSHTTLLNRIELHQTVRISTLCNLKPLFRYSPKLQHLHMSIPNDEDILPVLADCCPELITVSMSQGKINRFSQEVGRTVLSKNSIPGKLEHLVLDGVRSLQSFFPRLQQSTHSINSICLTPIEGAFMDWHPLSAFVLPALTYLHIDCHRSSNSFLRDQLPSVLVHCPSLERLVLQNKALDPQVSVTAPIFHAITKLVKLSCLRLCYFDIRHRMFSQLLEHCANQCSLQELGIIQCQGLTGTTMHDVARIKSLEVLELFGPDFLLTAEDTAEFTRLLCMELTGLSTLKLGQMKLSDPDARNIARCKNLSRLLLKQVHGFSAEGSTLLRGHIQQIEVGQ
ncbi:hypothetical protein BJV82DRAFT_612894 [Fennellomyces sp. T-0311]|nr:hypothetical protein BJV82DRAFT_612894 [Fennellomyces sp. T-0311]